jgi:uncharacterized protein YaeQ
MALTATIHVFDIDLSDADRGVYETLALRVARHPSESAPFLVTRLLAYCLEYREGIVFSKGISDPEDPAIAVRDLTGAMQDWIEVGAPDADRVHKAAKAAPRVAIYTHKDPHLLLRQWRAARIHRAGDIALYAFEPAFVDALVHRLDRRMRLGLAVSGGTLYVTVGNDTLTGVVSRHALADAA